MIENELEKLLKTRQSFFEIKADVTKIFEPRIFELAKENANNVRNTIIVETAIGTLAFLTLDKIPQDSIVSLILNLAVISLLLSIVFYSFYLKWIVGNSIKENKEALDRNIKIAEEGQKIIQEALDGNITFEESNKKLSEFYNGIEHKILRKEQESRSKKFSKEIAFGHLGNFLFISGLLLIVFSLIIYLLCN